MWLKLLPLLPLLLAILLHAHVQAMPAGLKDSDVIPLHKLPFITSSSTTASTFNSQDMELFTSMFLKLFKGIGDWRNMVAADTVQSMWQSPPIMEMSKRVFAG